MTYLMYLERANKCKECHSKISGLERDKSGAVKEGKYFPRLCDVHQRTPENLELKECIVRKQAKYAIYAEGDIVYIDSKDKKGNDVRTRRRIGTFMKAGINSMIPLSEPLKKSRREFPPYEGWHYPKDVRDASNRLICSGMLSLGWYPEGYEPAGKCKECGLSLPPTGICRGCADEGTVDGEFAIIKDKEE